MDRKHFRDGKYVDANIENIKIFSKALLFSSEFFHQNIAKKYMMFESCVVKFLYEHDKPEIITDKFANFSLTDKTVTRKELKRRENILNKVERIKEDILLIKKESDRITYIENTKTLGDLLLSVENAILIQFMGADLLFTFKETIQHYEVKLLCSKENYNSYSHLIPDFSDKKEKILQKFMELYYE